MSNFSETLRALMALENLNQEDLAQRTGVHQTTISRLLLGKSEPSSEQLGLLCTIISTARERRVELLLANLRDRAEAAKTAGIDERHYIITHAAADHLEQITATGSLVTELQLIADECTKYPDVRATISDLARMLLRHRAELADTASGIVYPFPSDSSREVAEYSPVANVLAPQIQNALDREVHQRKPRGASPTAKLPPSEPAARK